MQTARLVADSRERTEAFAAIATDLARAGATASALMVARAVDDREAVLESIVDLQPVPVYVASEDTAHSSVQAEAPEATLDVVAAFTDTKQRAIALAIVATAFANAGRPAEAVDMAAGIDGKPGYFAWRAIGKAQVKAGLTAQSNASFDRAVQVALSLNPNDWLLAQIAASQAEAGQIDEALHVAGLIRGERRYALRAIAKAQARVGRMAEATQNAHALVLRSEIIPPGLGVVAEALAEVGRIDEAIAAATIEDNVHRRSDLLACIAKARAAAGRINEAKQVARYVTERRDRATALTTVAAAQVKAGLTADAMATITEAMRIAQALPYKYQAATALIAIAASLP